MKYRKKKRSVFSPVIAVVVLVLGLAVAVKSVRRNTTYVTKAAGIQCTGQLSLGVSFDGKNPVTSVTLPSGIPTRYYLHVKQGSTSCTTNFDICVGASCTYNWGTYRSDQNGIARIDLDTPWPDNHVIRDVKVKPAGLNVAWSNVVTISFSSTVTNSLPAYNMANYIKFKPGYTFIYNSFGTNHNYIGKTRIQTEQEVQKCGISFYPWRFTKTAVASYWHPHLDKDLRWYVANPNAYYSGIPNFNNYFWVHSGTRYNRYQDANAIRDINFTNGVGPELTWFWNINTNNTQRIPHYNLGPKNTKVPYLNNSRTLNQGTTAAPDSAYCEMLVPAAAPYSPWFTRIEKDYVSINSGAGKFNYTGEVLRVDYIEGYRDNYTSSPGLKESYYYAENIGLVKFTSKSFNSYPTYKDLPPGSPGCVSDSDCWGDITYTPITSMELESYFQNPQLSVQVSADGVSYSTSINTTQDKGYYIRVSPPYTGYLAVGNNQKWLWVENGNAYIPNGYAVPNGTFLSNTASFKVWIPDEPVANETRVNLPYLPASNSVTVNVSRVNSRCPAAVTEYYGPYGFSGMNWCRVDGKLCSTEKWVTGPQYGVKCPSNMRLKNTGIYCDRGDGTKSFVGTSACVP